MSRRRAPRSSQSSRSSTANWRSAWRPPRTYARPAHSTLAELVVRHWSRSDLAIVQSPKQRSTIDAEDASGVGLVVFRRFEDLADVPALYLVERDQLAGHADGGIRLDPVVVADPV